MLEIQSAIEETFSDFEQGTSLLERNTDESLGEAPDDRRVRIMVTLPSEAASDPVMICDFLRRGMNIMRVNCAHDGPEEWRRMVEYLRLAEKDRQVLQNCLRPRRSQAANRSGFTGSGSHSLEAGAQ